MAERLTARAFTLLLAVSAAPLVAQPPPQTPVFGSDVRLVAVPVFVTDKAGHAVPGLTAADFEIEDQGNPPPMRSAPSSSTPRAPSGPWR